VVKIGNKVDKYVIFRNHQQSFCKKKQCLLSLLEVSVTLKAV